MVKHLEKLVSFGFSVIVNAVLPRLGVGVSPPWHVRVPKKREKRRKRREYEKWPKERSEGIVWRKMEGRSKKNRKKSRSGKYEGKGWEKWRKGVIKEGKVREKWRKGVKEVRERSERKERKRMMKENIWILISSICGLLGRGQREKAQQLVLLNSQT